ncbi:FAD-dependent oxidoreductase [Hymenobacter sp. ASUV-10]|uniref:FAD-dependent oxidoreductase n=1 Tax=Hymenobacter aranciens TaxID=3063996 RepID=A0ABT9B9B2_9BACT|nr:FAD-dependent oxidoreductase [Hymenobacter sp. ASUV-10]MDO7874757.1 FAD-dependent oxidoreductase [Hymenobacter sp. ASUV-10]
MKAGTTLQTTIDIAIIGAGVSGVYCAWRLQQAHPDKRIVVLEGSGTVGGRLLSVRPPGIKNMVAELGGMRILPATQPLITTLIEKLNDALPAEKTIELYDFPVDKPQNLAYLRGVYLRLADFTANPDKVPYRLSFLERGGTPGGIIVDAIEQIVPGITNPELTDARRREMVQHASFDGRPLHELGFWNLLLRIISPEAFQLGVDAGGYSSTLSNWNAADAIPWYLSDFGVAPHYKGFCEGFQSVPLALAELFEQAGGTILRHTRLEGFAEHDGGFELQLAEGPVHARQLILAMPRRSLDLLAPSSPPLQAPRVQALIGSVTPRPLFKLFTTYTNPWWRNAGYTTAAGEFVPVEAGRTVTDLPVRQTYYWPTIEGQPAVAGPAMLMASYDDGTSVGYWDGLRPRRRQAWQQGLEVAPPTEAFRSPAPVVAARAATTGADPTSDWHRYQAPAEMVQEVARQLGTIHGLTYTPQVQQAAFRDWGDDPFGGGWNSWNIGVRSWEVKHDIVQPIKDQPLFICGEAYSDAQGWVEGALQTADYVLEKMGLERLIEM